MLESGRAGQAKLWRALADATAGRTLVHCASRRDRTGVVVALLLEALGVAREQVVSDYATSATGMVAMLAHLEEHLPQAAPPSEAHRRPFVLTPARTMELFLAGVDDRWGGPMGWLGKLGLLPEVERLRHHLLHGLATPAVPWIDED